MTRDNEMQPRKRTMKAIVTIGIGGYEKLELRDVAVPELGPDDVLLEVLAAGVNNTELNTRLGWYSSSVREGTGETSEGEDRTDGGWNAATPFPLIQGTDCCGRIVAVGSAVDTGHIGLRYALAFRPTWQWWRTHLTQASASSGMLGPAP